MASETVDLDVFFSIPSPPPSLLCPERFAGITHESKLAVAKTLKADYVHRHGFINEAGFHNHCSHHLLAAFALGAPPQLLNAIYDAHEVRTLPALKSPGAITQENFYDHLGDKKYYAAYLQFFQQILLEKGAAAVIEEYVFSREANFAENTPGKQPRQMLLRFFAALYHSMIYVGYGLEFGILGLVAEGLAQTPCHPVHMPGLLTPEDFETAETAQSANGTPLHTLTSKLSSLLLNVPKDVSAAPEAAKNTDKADVHAFAILSRILSDERFSPSALGLEPTDDVLAVMIDYLNKTADTRRDVFLSYSQEWLPDLHNAGNIERKIEELSWMNALLYGVGGWYKRDISPNKKFNADFFAMHMVTSTLFFPPLVAYLSTASTTLLLRTYFRTSLAWWVSRGRPALPIREFYASTTPTPAQYGADAVKPAQGTLAPETITPNAWLPIVQTCLMHTDDHLCKIQRTLAHFAKLYGDRPAGSLAGENADQDRLDGVELIDGTLFVRIAALTADRIGWMREGQEFIFWDLNASFD
ncbi:hypothetical protein WOLCODRAFT_27361 [Wolfiporia cocos MD-104 SS10]|uniref:Oxidoreductase AflY n=1 Tax=Wolfiporia cocos (strain MD-104) TaxID=742152 RepID=A0A2H3IXI0_WOLCO|nr:hypothetical protein WOLCODRAFT_27361 [Wolfiporia cocos MD-104 SS10]